MTIAPQHARPRHRSPWSWTLRGWTDGRVPDDPRARRAAGKASDRPRRIPLRWWSSASIPASPMWLRRRRAAWPAARRRRRRGHRHPPPGCPRSAGWRPCTPASSELIEEHRPDAVALEALYFGQNVAHSFRGRAGARRRAAGRRPARDRLRRLHPAAGQGRGVRHRPRRQGAGRAHGPDAARRCPALPRPDHAADALAVAICHANHAPLRRGRGGGRGDRARRRGGRRSAVPTTSWSRPPAGSAIAWPCRPRRCARCPAWAARCRCTPIWSCATTRWPSTASPPRRSATSSWLLIGVQSVGPKVALAVLSGGTAARAGGARWWPATSTACRRCPASASAPAERIVVELREKVGVAERPRDADHRHARRRSARTSPATACWSSASQPAEAQALLEGGRGRDGRRAAGQRAAREHGR